MPQKKMGRPPSENPMDQSIRIRMDKKTLADLDECADALKTNRSDIVRRGIEKMHGDLKK